MPSAVEDLQRALNLQQVAKREDPNTEDALAQAYVLSEKYDRASAVAGDRHDAARRQPGSSVALFPRAG